MDKAYATPAAFDRALKGLPPSTRHRTLPPGFSTPRSRMRARRVWHGILIFSAGALAPFDEFQGNWRPFSQSSSPAPWASAPT